MRENVKMSTNKWAGLGPLALEQATHGNRRIDEAIDDDDEAKVLEPVEKKRATKTGFGATIGEMCAWKLHQIVRSMN